MAEAVSFGYKMSWLAARSVSPAQVVQALDIADANGSTWQDGIESVYAPGSPGRHPVFVTPDLDGWVLAASPAFFAEASDADPDRLTAFVAQAARRLGAEVQLFATHRVVEGHAWARADPDRLIRAYFYLGESGECLVDEGAPTPFEETLACLDPNAADPPDEAAVMSVAGAWSIDPTTLDARFPEIADGLLGTVATAAVETPDPIDPRPGAKPWWKFW